MNLKALLRHGRRCGLVAAAIVAVTAGGAAVAQSVDPSVLIDRIERLERELITLQRQIYRGGPTSAPSAAPAGAAGGNVEGNFAAQTEIRFAQFEIEMRFLTGKIEELGFAIDQLRARLEKLVGDVDFRLGALEQGRASASAGQPAPAQPAASAAAARPPGGAGQNPGQPPTTEGVLGTLRTGQAPDQTAAAPQPPAGAARPPAQPSAPASLPSGPPDEQYKFAFDVLARQRDYAGAENAFRAFLKANPSHALAGNAQYWLAETHYARKEFEKAAVEFAEGFKKYPKDSKAPDNVLKLGMSLAALGQNAEACRALQGYDQRFPGEGQNLQTLQERAQRERQRLNCR